MPWTIPTTIDVSSDTQKMLDLQAVVQRASLMMVRAAHVLARARWISLSGVVSLQARVFASRFPNQLALPHLRPLSSQKMVGICQSSAKNASQIHTSPRTFPPDPTRQPIRPSRRCGAFRPATGTILRAKWRCCGTASPGSRTFLPCSIAKLADAPSLRLLAEIAAYDGISPEGVTKWSRDGRVRR